MSKAERMRMIPVPYDCGEYKEKKKTKTADPQKISCKSHNLRLYTMKLGRINIERKGFTLLSLQSVDSTRVSGTRESVVVEDGGRKKGK